MCVSYLSDTTEIFYYIFGGLHTVWPPVPGVFWNIVHRENKNNLFFPLELLIRICNLLLNNLEKFLSASLLIVSNNI